MKTILKKFILFSAVVLCVSVARAQDYVITAGGDSISCKIRQPIFGGMPKYQSAEMSEAKKINPNDIKEYYIAKGKIWQRSVQRENHIDPIFLTILEKGKINLYELLITTNFYGVNGGASTTTKTWYISKGSDVANELKTNGFAEVDRKTRKDELATALIDNQPLYNKYLAEKKFSYSQIRKLIHAYNTGEEFGSK